MPLPAAPRPPSPRHPVLGRTEELLLRTRLLDGDSLAWRDFHAAYGGLVRATIGRVVGRFERSGSSEDAREILGTFYLELWSAERAKLRAFESERGVRLGTWIAMLASHAAYDFLRRRRRDPAVPELADLDAVASEAPHADVLVEQKEQARRVRSLLARFSERDRTFVDLYFAEGLEPDEVATRMGISVKTVYSKKHKIQARLGTLLDGDRLAA